MNDNLRNLAQQYAEAVYVVFEEKREIRFCVGENSAEIDALLEKYGAEKFAFLTAHNPYSEQLTAAENAARQSRLRDILRDQHLRFLEGYGTDEAESWGRETSVFVLDITEETAVKFGQEFGQNAVLCGVKNEECRLVWC